MGMTMGIRLCVGYDDLARLWHASPQVMWGEDCFRDVRGVGRTRDEAVGNLVRKLIESGMDQEAVYLSLEGGIDV